MIPSIMGLKNEKTSDYDIEYLNSPEETDRVYDLVRKIPSGKVSTYGDLARALGTPLASRAIGRILAKNPNPIVVPCHRVVKSDGRVGGYAYGSQRKKELLEKEGISFINETVCDFDKVRISPHIH